MSPYLFITCAEGLTSLLRKSERIGELNSIKVVGSAPSISCLLFADDSLMFCNARGSKAQKLKDVLVSYSNASGQVINFDKSSISFSPRVSENIRQEIKDILEVREKESDSKYLGLPSFVGRKKKEVFAYLRERVWSKIQGWKTKLLSRSGKEILWKSVVQSMQTYAMSVFLLPKSLYEEI